MSDDVKQLSLVICLPFKIRQGDDPSESLGSVCKFLNENSRIWHPVPAPTESESDDRWKRFQDYQARVYFHPSVRRFLYNRHKVARFIRSDVKKVSVKGRYWDGKSEVNCSIDFNVRRCELVLFQPDIGVLLLELSNTESDQGKCIKSLTLKQTQWLLDTTRRIYPPYFDSHTEEGSKEVWKSGHCPTEVCLLDSHGTPFRLEFIARLCTKITTQAACSMTMSCLCWNSKTETSRLSIPGPATGKPC